MKLFKASLLSLAVLTAPSIASANDWSVGVFVGQSSIDGLSDACANAISLPNILLSVGGVIGGDTGRLECGDVDDKDTSLGLNVTYNINDNWGVEVGYLGLGDYTAVIGGAVNGVSVDAGIVTDANALYASVVATLPLNDKFSLSARAGAVEVSGDITASGNFIRRASESFDQDTEFAAGVSLDYRFSDKVSVQLRYDNFDIIDVAGLGFKYHY